MIDLLPVVAAELAAYGPLVALTGPRVRVHEPAPGDADKPWRPFVVLVDFGYDRASRLPVQRRRVLARCYGDTAEQAATVLGLVSDGLHRPGDPRLGADDEPVWSSRDEIGQGTDEDPVTRQPLASSIFIIVGGTQPYVAP